jgi:hypothetical protein
MANFLLDADIENLESIGRDLARARQTTAQLKSAEVCEMTKALGRGIDDLIHLVGTSHRLAAHIRPARKTSTAQCLPTDH